METEQQKKVDGTISDSLGLDNRYATLGDFENDFEFSMECTI